MKNKTHMRNDKNFVDVTVRDFGFAWINMNEVEAVLDFGGNQTLVRMKSGREYIVKFDIDGFAKKADLNLYD